MVIPIHEAINLGSWFLCECENKVFKFKLEYFSKALYETSFKCKYKIANIYHWEDSDIYLLVFSFIQLNGDVSWPHPMSYKFKLIDEDGYIFEELSDHNLQCNSIYAKENQLNESNNSVTEIGENYNFILSFNMPTDDKMKYSLVCDFDDIREI